MTWVLIAAALATGIDWRRLAILGLATALPVPALLAVGVHWWRSRPDLSMRAASFCDAVSTELRAGASLRFALESSARSVDALEMSDLCRGGAPLAEIAQAARTSFPEIGEELGALLTRTDGMGVGPAALFDEMGSLALAQVEVAHEVAAAAAPAKAAGIVMLGLPTAAIAVAAGRGGLDLYLAQPAQRAAALWGLALTCTGLLLAVMILHRAR